MIDKDKVIQLAKDAGVSITVHKGKPGGPWSSSDFVTPDIERFAQAIYRQGLEDAAKEAQSYWDTFKATKEAHERFSQEPFRPERFGFNQERLHESHRIAAAVRSLKESTNG